MRRKALALAAVACAGVLACSCIGEPEYQAGMSTIDHMVDQGTMTPSQAAVLRGIIEKSGQFRLLEPLVGAAIAWLMVRIQRGPSATTEERAERVMARKVPLATAEDSSAAIVIDALVRAGKMTPGQGANLRAAVESTNNTEV